MANQKLPKRLTDALEARRKHTEASTGRVDKIRARTAELAAELETAREELKGAVDKSVQAPTPTNEAKETEIRRRIADLELQVAGGDERVNRSGEMDREEGERLTAEVRRIGEEEADAFFTEGYPKQLKEIADAKEAYLRALQSLHYFRKDALEIFRASRNNPLNNRDLPSCMRLEPAFNYYGGERNVYGISDYEANLAYERGIIRKTSVAEGRPCNDIEG